MLITEVLLHRARLPLDPSFHAAWDLQPRTHLDATVVEVRTDDGIVGYGSGDTMTGFESYLDLFVGKDPLAIAEHVRVIETIDFHAARYWPMEAALWDIAGKACGQPAATLLGGATDRLRAYASFGALCPPDERAERAVAAVERGFRAMKLRIAADQVGAGVAAVRAVREAVGPDIAVMVDLNQMWRMSGDTTPALDAVSVRRLAAELAELDVYWLEEPLPQHDLPAVRTVREQTGIRVAGGEMVRTLAELVDLVQADAFDIYQPDVVLSAGMSRCRFLAELAHLKHRWFTPHTWTNGLGLAANLQVAAGVGNVPYLEFPYDPPGWTEHRRDFFLTEPLTVDGDGWLTVPRSPGLGVTVDHAALRRYAVS
ncbi:MAG: mandelate racemase/muconate lactonizing enzyme family protein [Streptosporangiales bacterium]|nr:mandelate racemase/muconate lactonizing enzyme family protein [Streptosporangiales bacterium]